MTFTRRAKWIGGILALIVSTGIPAGLWKFYERNAWAEDVKLSQQQLAQKANAAFLRSQLEISKLKVFRFLDIKSERQLTPQEELEFQIAQQERQLAARALAEIQTIEVIQ